jgi:CheY-like chemotaxis protein
MTAPSRKILIVDDNAGLSQMLKLQLEHAGGFIVRVQNDATAALASARQFRPHLVILDVMMPGLDGGHVAAQMKADRILRQTPVIFLTGSVRKEEVADRNGLIGGWPFLAKPARLEELLHWIDTLAPATTAAARPASTRPPR